MAFIYEFSFVLLLHFLPIPMAHQPFKSLFFIFDIWKGWLFGQID